MPDMLVKLYDLTDLSPIVKHQEKSGVCIRRAIPPEKHVIVGWIRENCNERYASQCEVAFAHYPVSCFIAVENERPIGFACYDAACRGFFGPMEVSADVQGRGIGKALLLVCLYDMAAQGYAYAILGAVGPVEFYRKSVGAVTIEGSTPGIYRGMLTS